MKKILSLVVCMLICLSIQASHLKFMGIPLDGTITQFHADLIAKGLVPDVEYNKQSPVGCRLFKGTFSGKEARVFVYYDEKTKIVYRAKAVIVSNEESMSENDYDYFVKMLSQKYGDAEKKYDRQDGYETITFFVPNPYLIKTYAYLGSIDVYRSKYSYSSYSVHVDYTDTINSVKHENRNMEDL